MWGKLLLETPSSAWLSLLVKISTNSTKRWKTRCSDPCPAAGGTFYIALARKKTFLSLPPSETIWGWGWFAGHVHFQPKPVIQLNQCKSGPAPAEAGEVSLTRGGVQASGFQPSVVSVYYGKQGVAQLWMESQDQADLAVSHQGTPWASLLKDSQGLTFRLHTKCNGFGAGLEP